jgi:hypothetical protein
MRTRRHHLRKNKSRKIRGGKKWGGKTGKKWTTAIEAAQSTLSKTGSLHAAKKTLKKQALFNARKLFGSVGNI